ncbi:RNase adapter RapZ [Proteinivorax hydrogeniformans]|uniref:RNase adapter RapZ n=1 Tax=Proteinivorax hydrogeniformans TaxID=1826727 RepID=A0AAU8HV45_9FIRM
MKFVIITGMSGAGKTLALRSFEDMGYFCIDNLPPKLIPKFAEICKETDGEIEKVAIVVDIRGGKFFSGISKVLEDTKLNPTIVYLEATDDVLIRRFKETRRTHPLAPGGGRPIEGIAKEREQLALLREAANHIVDTSEFTGHQLSKAIKEKFQKGYPSFTVNVMSFGFRYGIPHDADLVFDVRFLPNPHYIQDLQPKTGDDKEVQQYVMKHKVAQDFLKKLEDMVNFLLPLYKDEGKAQVMIAIGCTGGKHRSVTLANILAEKFEENENVNLLHRDVTKGREKVER